MPYSDPAARAAYRKKYNETHRDKRRLQHRDVRHSKSASFCGVDGEGGNIGGRHEYLLLRAGNRVLENGNGRPLTSVQCFDFLSSLESGREYVSYFFTYDVTMMLRDLGSVVVGVLLNRAARTPLDGSPPVRVRWKNFSIDWMPGKEFRIGKWGTGKPFRWVVISDVGSFFQCSFVKALERWDIGSEALRKRIAASKAKRSGFEAITDLTRLYNKKECDLLELLMTEFRSVVGSVGPHPRFWQGPGNLASAWLRDHDVPSEQNVPYECLAFARDGYYGGRFEITAVGAIRRKVYQYDINSAYPAVISSLPCLVHGAWKHTTKIQPRRRTYIARVTFYHKENTFLGTLPIRSKEGNISYPRRGSGIYWSVELAAAKRAGCQITVEEAWEYIPDCSCHPMEWIKDVYALRRQVGKSKKGNALKLAMNSIYGKFAQSIGRPKWANPIWAGLITATTRAWIIDACRKVDARHILMIATDGIFSDVPLDVTCGPELGEWELTEHESMFIIQPGLYMMAGQDSKTRGIPRVKIDEYARQIRRSWGHGATDMHHTITLNRFMAARQAYHLKRWDRAGEWYSEGRTVSFDWRTKRSETEGWWDERLFKEDMPAFRPAIKDGGVPSVPYDKSIGRWELERRFEDDQPEEADGLLEMIGEL